MEIYKIHVYPGRGVFMHTSAKQYDLNQRLAAVLRVVSDNYSINKVACELDRKQSVLTRY